MTLRFASSQSVELELPGSLSMLQSYLDQPSRLVYALFDADRVDDLGNNVFRLRMQPFRFFMLKITPTVDLRVWTTSHVLHIEAVDCQISGIDTVNQQFNLTLTGQLRPVPGRTGSSGDDSGTDDSGTDDSGTDDSGTNAERSRAEGEADLAVAVELPPPLAVISNALIRKSGNKLLSGILATIKQRLVSQLRNDYTQWASSHADQVHA